MHARNRGYRACRFLLLGYFRKSCQFRKPAVYNPKWLVIATPPILFFHLGLALYFVLRENVYTDNGKMVRGWTWAFWITLFIATAITPFFIYHNMPTAAYIMSSITTALALGTTILCYRQSIAAGVVMTVFLVVVGLIMIYLGYWAFA